MSVCININSSISGGVHIDNIQQHKINDMSYLAFLKCISS